MKFRLTYLWIIVIVICAVVLGLFSGNSGPPTFPSVMFLGSCTALFSAIGLWIGVDNQWRRIPLQLISFVFVVSVLVFSSSVWHLFSVILMSVLGGSIVFVVSLPIIGYRLTKNGLLTKPLSDELGSFNEVMQFGVTHLIILTTAVAIFISVGQWLTAWISNFTNSESLLSVLKLGLTLAIGSVTSVWATLGRRPLRRTLFAALLVVVTACLNYFLIQQGPFQWAYSALTIVAWIETMILLWCLRIEGYRFVSRPRTKST